MTRDADPAQTRAIESWIRHVLTCAKIQTVRFPQDGSIGIIGVPAKYVAVIDALSAGILAAARGEELPEVRPIAARPIALAKRRR